MTNFSDYLFRLKSTVSLRELLERDGIQLKPAGRGLKGLCPFHQEDTASFHCYDREGRYYCYGCRASGDAIDYVCAKQGLDWMGAVRWLAGQAGLPLPERSDEEEQEAKANHDAEACLDTFVSAAHQALLNDPEALAYVVGRGITLETIQERRIGLATYSGLRMDTATAKRAGLLTEQGSPTMLGRITLPVVRHGRVVNISGRAFRGEEKPKYKSLLGRRICPSDSHLLRAEGTVVLCEGIIDAILLQQAGVPAVATIGTSVTEAWLPMFGRDTTFALCYDNDANQAGQKAAESIGKTLFEAGYRVSVVSLPAGQDPADVLTGEGGASVLSRALSLAMPYVDYVISRLPAPRSAHEQHDQLTRTIFPLIHRLPPIAVDTYLQNLCKRFGTRIAVMRQAWEEFQKGTTADKRPADSAGGETELTPVFNDDDPIMFNPAQAFVPEKGVGCYTVYTEAAGQGQLQPFLVFSDRKIRALTPAVARELGLIFRQNKYPGENIRWSIGKKYRNCVSSWIEAREDLNAGALYREVRGLFERSIHWGEDLAECYDFIALWVIGTYVHQVFDTYPYAHVRAIAGSGKTTLLRIVEAVAFNGAMSAAITESVVSRMVNADSATLCIDEAENYQRKGQEESSFIFEVLNSGYKKGNFSRKAGSKKDNFRPESFDTYSPKFLASIQQLDATLATRCIDIPLLKADKRLEAFLPQEIDRQLREIRGSLYCWGLAQWENVAEAYTSTQPEGEFINRQWELWKPLFALASVFEAATGEPLTERIKKLAEGCRERQAARSEEQNPNQRLMAAIMDYIRQARPTHTDEFYPVTFLCDFIKSELGWKEFTAERLSRFVFDEAHLASDRQEDKVKKRIIQSTRPVWHIRLRQEQVWRNAVALFEFPKEILEEIGEAPEPSKEFTCDDPFVDQPGTDLEQTWNNE